MKLILLHIFILLLASGIVVYIGYNTGFFTQREKIVIKEIEKPVIRYIKEIKNDNTDELWNCYRTPIAITYQMQADTMHVRAQDGCKETRQDIRLETTDRDGWKMYAAVGGGALVIGGVAGLLLHR